MDGWLDLFKNNWTTEAAKLFMNAMILPHITYCPTSWSETCKTTLKPTEIVYKRAGTKF